MKIAMVAPFEEAVPPYRYGGTELVVYNLVTTLVSLGHEVTVFGSGDSQVPCRLIPIFPQAIRTIEPYMSDLKAREAAKFLGISKIVSILQKEYFDIVHNHIGWRFLLSHALVSHPMITTLHGPMSMAYEKVGYEADSEASFVSISDNQRNAIPTLSYVKTVYNGIDASLFPFRGNTTKTLSNRGEYVVFLGRMSPEKGVMEAIEVARRTKKKLVIATKIDIVDQEYAQKVQSSMKGADVELLDEIDIGEKARLLGDATAMLAPIQWEEPFGLNVVESMACGTPVLGMARGSFPELITPGTNGFLAHTVDEMVADVARVSLLDRDACRQTVLARFTKERMTDAYIEAYQTVLNR
jgi:glycosyltransferase involved in cell wall biosynthesis